MDTTRASDEGRTGRRPRGIRAEGPPAGAPRRERAPGARPRRARRHAERLPDHAEAAGLAVLDGRAERAILVCGSGVGVAAAANKLPGIRAAMCHDHYSAHQGVEHDDMNVLALGARIVGDALALELADAFLAARFDGAERHARRTREP